MPGKRIFFFALLIGCLQFQLQAQMAKYANLPDAYDIKIAENTGNTIHVWSASDEQSFFQFKNITLTLHVFSPDLRIIAKKRFILGKIRRWSIDFQYADSCYYANILSVSENSIRAVFRIDHNGNFKDVSDSPRAAIKPGPFKQLNKVYAITRNNDKLFAIITEDAVVVTDNKDLDNVSLLGRQNLMTGKNLQKVTIKRTNIRGRSELEKGYGSSYLSFSYPNIDSHDTTIIAYAFAQPVNKDRSNPYNGSYLFLTKLNTSLHEPPEGSALLKISERLKGDDYYSPCCSFSLADKFFIINTGRSNYEPVRYYSTYRPGSMPYVPPSTYFSLINSLRITVIDAKNALLKDTIIGSGARAARFQWDTRYITASDKKIDIFCSVQYRASKYGITHMSIDSEGTMQENNIIVDEHYNYLLSAAKKMSTGELIVPYAKNGRTRGIMKLEYDGD